MGSNNLVQIGTATPVEATGDLVDQYLTAISTDFVPRNASGVVTSLAGNLGSSTYKWGALYVDNILIDGNTISSTSGALNLTAFAGQDIVLTTSSGGEVTTSGNLTVLGELTMTAQPVFIANCDDTTFNDTPTPLDFSNAKVWHEIGGDWFDSAVDVNKITPPSNGTYKIILEIDKTEIQFDTRAVYMKLIRYNSSATPLNEHWLMSVISSTDTIVLFSPIFRITTGDYIEIVVAHTTSGGTGQ